LCHYIDGNAELEVSMISARSQYSMCVVIVTGYIAAGQTTAFGQALADAHDAHTVVSCQHAIGNGAIRFAHKKSAQLDKCARQMQGCVENGASDCADRFEPICRRAFDKIASARAKLLVDVVRRCGTLPDSALLDSNGLGFANIADECTAAGGALNDVTDVAQCIGREYDCATEALFSAELPRAGEMMRLAGIDPAALACLPDHGGNGAGVGNTTTAKSIAACVKATHAAAGRFVEAATKRVGACLRALFGCVQEAQNAPACVAAADKVCDRAFAAMPSDADVQARIGPKCAAIAYGALSAADGANLSALAPACAALGVSSLGSLDDYLQCLVRQHECRIEGVVHTAFPRADELLTGTGHTFRSTFCPTPTVTPSPTPSATPTATLTLPLPTITLPLPTITLPLPTITLPLPTVTLPLPTPTVTPSATVTP
jgi:hypothetical protein